MSVQRSLAAKRNTGAGTTGDIDTILPLLFAANPSITPNYKKMSAMDSHGRTAAALEHKFRKWRQIGREILAAHPEEAGKDHAVGQPAQTKTPRTPKKQGNKNDREGEDGNLKPKSATRKRGAAANTDEESPATKPRGQKGATQKSKGPAKALPKADGSEEEFGEATMKQEEEDMSGEEHGIEEIEMEFQ